MLAQFGINSIQECYESYKTTNLLIKWVGQKYLTGSKQQTVKNDENV